MIGHSELQQQQQLIQFDRNDKFRPLIRGKFSSSNKFSTKLPFQTSAEIKNKTSRAHNTTKRRAFSGYVII